MFDLNIPKDGVGDTPQSTPAKTHKQLSDNLLAMLDKMQQQVQYNARLLTQVVVVHALNKKRYRVPANMPGRARRWFSNSRKTSWRMCWWNWPTEPRSL